MGCLQEEMTAEACMRKAHGNRHMMMMMVMMMMMIAWSNPLEAWGKEHDGMMTAIMEGHA